MTALRRALEATDRDLRVGFENILHPDRFRVGSRLGSAGAAEERLWEAIRYAVMGGGKRIRPFLVLQTSRLFGVLPQNALQVAMAVELLHCYSLAHDDLPCMDDDFMRRGRPSLHVQFGEAVAVLAGDALQSLAFEIVSRSHENPKLCLQLVRRMAEAVGGEGMVAGQMIDMHMETSDSHVSIENITRLQRLKTGRMFEFACEAAAIIGQSGEEETAAIKFYAHDLGLAFQMTDDLLDAAGDKDKIGKSKGKDQQQNKATWVWLLGVEKTRLQAEFLCRQAISHLSLFDERADLLRLLAESLPQRES